MSLFTKIKQDWQARRRRRLAAELQRMIAAAADENDGALSLRCDMILHGDMFACGEIVTCTTICANEGIHTDGALNARVITAHTRLIAAEILSEGDVVTHGRIASMGDAYVHGRIDSHDDVTACADTPDWATVPQKRERPTREGACGEESPQNRQFVNYSFPNRL